MPKEKEFEHDKEDLRAFFALLRQMKFVETGDPKMPIWVGTQELTHEEYTALVGYRDKLDAQYFK